MNSRSLLVFAELLLGVVAALWLVPAPLFSEALTFRRALQLASEHSPGVAVARAEQQRAYAAYRESRDAFLPQVTLGSGLGYSAGFPLSLEGSAPSIFNVNTQQFLFNRSQKAIIGSTRAQWSVASLATEDQRKQSMLDASLAYVELAKISSELQALARQQQSADQLAQIEQQRVTAGVDSPVLLTRVKLNSARNRMRVAQLEDSALALRKQLGELTGLSPQEIETVPDSMPPIPSTIEREDEENLKMRIADQQVAAAERRAEAEHRARWPAIDLAGQYALLGKFNNYLNFYKTFQRNNGTFGLSIRFPFLNFVQGARTQEADAELVKARHQAQITRNQTSAEIDKLRSTVKQFQAAREIAQLEYELARADTSAIVAKVEAGAATIADEGLARAAEDEKFSTLLDSNLALEKAELQLLRSTGGLERWALSQK